MGGPSAKQWYTAFVERVGHHRAAGTLRDAALSQDLRSWTRALTDVVADSFREQGWRPVAKGHAAERLPVPRQEYLGIDVTGLFDAPAATWTFPAAVCELENSLRDEVVAYSLWKVLCVRAPLRVVFGYRAADKGCVALVRRLQDDVIGALPVESRTRLGGDTLMVVGTRDESTTFPYGFFRPWCLNRNTGRFEKLEV